MLILGCGAWLRAPEYDEAYSIFLTAGDPRPAWPAGVFHAGDVRPFYQGDASPREIAVALRKGDVHPPLYFWLLEYWRRLAGASWFAARLLSVLLSLFALASIAWVAALAEIPAAAAILIALFSYGFAYTGIVARGFALAQALNLMGIALILSATRSPKPSGRLGLAAGLAFGAAAFSNYLAVFIGLAAFFWAGLEQERRRILPAAALGFAVFLPAMLYFFHAQQHSRIGQFQPFSLGHAVPLLAKDFGAAIFGGLPVYAGRAGGIVTAALAMLSLICAGAVVKNWRPRLALFALSAVSVPAGLLALGLIFNNRPIEIRYLAFATPYLALLLGQTLTPGLRYLLLGVQACGIIGLIFAPSTMQPQGLAARQAARLDMPAALVLLPFGNDGVGVPGPFIAAAPDHLRIELVKPGTPPDLSGEQSVILALVRADDSSKTTTRFLLASLNANPCWRVQSTTNLLKTYARTCPNF
jgi:hypothetical protein